jgi:hypothetical protein
MARAGGIRTVCSQRPGSLAVIHSGRVYGVEGRTVETHCGGGGAHQDGRLYRVRSTGMWFLCSFRFLVFGTMILLLGFLYRSFIIIKLLVNWLV